MPATLLVINPNTSASVTDLLQRHVQARLGAALQVRSVTARFGAPYISCEASYAVANHATLDAWAAAVADGQRPSAVLIGCFGDPGLFALRDGAGVPVSGLAEAAFAAAARHGRFAIVTGGERWKPMLERLAHALGYSLSPDGRLGLAGIHAVAPSGAQLAADPMSARLLLRDACRAAAERFQADAVILGGAGLAGMAVDIAASVPVPLIDSVTAGAEWAAQAIQAASVAARDAASGLAGQADRVVALAGFGIAWHNVSPELAALC